MAPPLAVAVAPPMGAGWMPEFAMATAELPEKSTGPTIESVPELTMAPPAAHAFVKDAVSAVAETVLLVKLVPPPRINVPEFATAPPLHVAKAVIAPTSKQLAAKFAIERFFRARTALESTSSRRSVAEPSMACAAVPL